MTATELMQRALALARRGEGFTRPNPAVGAIVVKDGEIVGEGFHPAAGMPHAEIYALKEAGEAARGADLYVTLEPCCHTGRTGPCTEAVIAAGVARVFAAIPDPNPRVSGQGFAVLRQAGIDVHVGLCSEEAERLIAPFARHIRSGLPLVTLKAAITLDGFVATAGNDSRWISSETSRSEAHRLRHCHDAIVVGSGTVLADNPRLTTRLADFKGIDPLRIVLDSRLRTPATAALLHSGSNASTLIATVAGSDPRRCEELTAVGAEILLLPAVAGRVFLPELLAELGRRGVQSLLIEGGGEVAHAFLTQNLVDRVSLFVAPLLLGGGGIPLFSGTGVQRLSDAWRLRSPRYRRLADDILVEGEIDRCSPD